MTGSLTKHATICILLEHRHHIWDPFTSPQDSPGDGDGTPHMPPMSHHPSVVELERCLRQLRDNNRPTYVHLRTYYDAPTRLVHAKHTRRRNGRAETIHDDHTQRILPPWLADIPTDHKTQLPITVLAGTHTLTTSFRGKAELPNELRQALSVPYAA